MALVAAGSGDEVVQQDSATSSDSPPRRRKSKKEGRSRSPSREERDTQVDETVKAEQRIVTLTKGRPRSRMSSGSNGPNRHVGQKDAREIAGHPDVLPGPPFRAPSAGNPVVHGRWIREAGGRISSSPGRRYGPTKGRSKGLSSHSEEAAGRYRKAELTGKGIGGPTTLPIDDGMEDYVEDVLGDIWTEDQLSLIHI